MAAPGWETFDHIADIGVRGWGRDVDEAFANGAKAMFSIMVEDLSVVRPEQSVDVTCDSFDLAGLFVAWLNRLIAEADLRDMVFCQFSPSVHMDELTLEGRASGQHWDRLECGRGIEVKGATFSEAEVKRVNGLWMAQCIVDV